MVLRSAALSFFPCKYSTLRSSATPYVLAFCARAGLQSVPFTINLRLTHSLIAHCVSALYFYRSRFENQSKTTPRSVAERSPPRTASSDSQTICKCPRCGATLNRDKTVTHGSRVGQDRKRVALPDAPTWENALKNGVENAFSLSLSAANSTLDVYKRRCDACVQQRSQGSSATKKRQRKSDQRGAHTRLNRFTIFDHALAYRYLQYERRTKKYHWSEARRHEERTAIAHRFAGINERFVADKFQSFRETHRYVRDQACQSEEEY